MHAVANNARGVRVHARFGAERAHLEDKLSRFECEHTSVRQLIQFKALIDREQWETGTAKMQATR